MAPTEPATIASTGRLSRTLQTCKFTSEYVSLVSALGKTTGAALQRQGQKNSLSV